MSWIRSSKYTTLVVLLALSLLAVGTVSGISVSDETGLDESRVDETVTATVVIEDPFQDKPDSWTLKASTELENVSWTVTVLQQGNQVSETVYGDKTFEQDLDLDNGGDEVRIELTGDTPEVSNYTYEPRETYTLWDLASISGSSESDLNTTKVHHYTNESREARQSIDEAKRAINESGGNEQASNLFNRSVSAYNNKNFPNAKDLATDAKEEAEKAKQSKEQTQTLLYAAVAIVVIALVGGGLYYWRSQQNEPTKLQ